MSERKQPTISQLEQRLAELSSVMGSISDAVLAVDQSATALFFNSKFALVFGNVDAAFERHDVASPFRSCLRSGKPASEKITVESEDGQKQYFSLSVSPLINKDGDAYGAVGIFHDVTELKRAEKMRIDFVANVSHELRTPLTAIKGYTDTLKLDISDNKPVTPSFLDVISRNTERLIDLINDLLDLSALESSGETLARETLETRAFSERVIERLRPEAARKKQVIKLSTKAETISAEPGLLEQVISNLIGNAIKYCPSGSTVEVFWEKKKDSVALRVIDDGPGIPKKHHDRLFERFYRIDKARSREMGGTGLGLAIVKHIMQRHGGTVSVESEPGQGTTFVCTFPS